MKILYLQIAVSIICFIVSLIIAWGYSYQIGVLSYVFLFLTMVLTAMVIWWPQLWGENYRCMKPLIYKNKVQRGANKCSGKEK